MKMMECLQAVGVDGKYLRIISILYWKQKAVITVQNEYTTEVDICQGVRQYDKGVLCIHYCLLYIPTT